MNENPYRSPESRVDQTGTDGPSKNHGYLQVSLGYAFLAIYVFAAYQIAQITSSTARYDRIVSLEYFLWLTPFLVLIPWLSLKALGKNNQPSIRYSSAALLFIFIVSTALILAMLDPV